MRLSSHPYLTSGADSTAARRPVRVLSDARWDKTAGVVRYRLKQLARVQARVGLTGGGPLLRTLVDWAPREAGLHAEAWDGHDRSGALDLSNDPRLSIQVVAVTLPRNTILLGTPRPLPARRKGASTWSEVPADQSRPAVVPFGHGLPYDNLGDFALEVTLPEDLPVDGAQRPIVSGPVPLRIIAPPDVVPTLQNHRYEIVVYLVSQNLFEVEIAHLPFTWRWDPASAPDGEHLLTANIRSYTGPVGTGSTLVIVRNPLSEE